MSDLRMPDLNKVIVAGRLTRDPELKYTSSGKPFCRLSVANSRRFRAREGAEWQEETTFVEVAVWGPQAEYVGQKLGRDVRSLWKDACARRSGKTKPRDRSAAVWS